MDQFYPVWLQRYAEEERCDWHARIYVSDDCITAFAIEKIGEWLSSFRIPFDSIWADKGKPIADLYIDDKALNVPQNPTEQDLEGLKDFIDDYLENN